MALSKDQHPVNVIGLVDERDGQASGFELGEGAISLARTKARTVDEMLASVASLKTPFAMSPYSKRTNPNDTDLGWAAGIMDGEGCIHIARQKFGKNSGRRPVYRLRVQIAQTSRTHGDRVPIVDVLKVLSAIGR